MPPHVPDHAQAHVNANWLDAVSAVGWRAVVLVVVGLFGVYALIALIRLWRLRRRPAAVPELVAPTLSEAPPMSPEPPPPPETVESPSVSSAREVPLDAYDAELPWVKAPVVSDEQSRLVAVEMELLSLRGEVAELRQSLAALADELRQEVAAALPRAQAAAHVSPLYGDAMQMAQAGHDAESISGHCGIARAEAELVVALVQRQESAQAAERENDGGPSRY